MKTKRPCAVSGLQTLVAHALTDTYIMHTLYYAYMSMFPHEDRLKHSLLSASEATSVQMSLPP